MAKQPLKTRVAREAANNARKDKAAKIAEQKAAKVEAVLTTGQLVPIGGKPNLSSDINPDTAKAAGPDQKYIPTKAQAEFVAKLAEGNDFPVVLERLKHSTESLTWEVACICVALAYRLNKFGKEELPLLHEFMKSIQPLGTGNTLIRSNAVRAWLLRYAPVSWGVPLGKESGNDFLWDAQKHQAQKGQLNRNTEKFVSDRLETPFWKVKSEKEYQEFDFLVQLKQFSAKIEKLVAMPEEERTAKYGPEDKRQLDLTGAKEFLELVTKTFKAKSANVEVSKQIEESAEMAAA